MYCIRTQKFNLLTKQKIFFIDHGSGTSEEIAKAVLFLASDDIHYWQRTIC